MKIHSQSYNQPNNNKRLHLHRWLQHKKLFEHSISLDALAFSSLLISRMHWGIFTLWRDQRIMVPSIPADCILNVLTLIESYEFNPFDVFEEPFAACN